MFIGYLRVSTGRQEISGLGIDAQKESIERYAAQSGDVIAETYVETESGAAKSRPQLEAALSACRRQKATLLIAKLDRLARNVAFVSSLMEAGVDFVACDAPYANRLMIHILSAFAEHEREQISERTKAALAAAKARGVPLGRHAKVLAVQNRRRADLFARKVSAEISEIAEMGIVSFGGIANELNRRGVPSAAGGRWYATTVGRIITRAKIDVARHS